jgi:N6-L-threonylcarbamoyladenine synthase
MTILAIETSCDETAVAVMRDRELLASEIASQAAEHEKFGGVVPEVASRNHLLHAPRLLERVAERSGISLRDVDAFAATSGPGLATSLMVGASIAKGLAIGFAKPYVAINHLEGHLLSPFFGAEEIQPHVALIVSGGHTLLVDVAALGDYTILGRTVDDAAGEAFDKVAKMLGLGYPGGPEIERNALNGNSARFDFPRSMLDSGDHNFSFSGLKTAVRYLLPKISAADRDDVCASFQRAVVEVLATKTTRAAKGFSRKLVTVSGGVSCNGALRRALSDACETSRLQLRTAASQLCTDNAAMIAFAAMLRLSSGRTSAVSEEIDPNLALVG